MCRAYAATRSRHLEAARAAGLVRVIRQRERPPTPAFAGGRLLKTSDQLLEACDGRSLRRMQRLERQSQTGSGDRRNASLSRPVPASKTSMPRWHPQAAHSNSERRRVAGNGDIVGLRLLAAIKEGPESDPCSEKRVVEQGASHGSLRYLYVGLLCTFLSLCRLQYSTCRAQKRQCMCRQ